MDFKGRAPSRFVSLKDLAEAEYRQSTEKYKLSSATTKAGDEVSRARVWGTIVKALQGQNFSSITIDDSTETMQVIAFGEDALKFDGFNEGDLVTVIGKVRERDGEKQLLAESVRKITDPNEVLYHKAMTEKSKGKKFHSASSGDDMDAEEGESAPKNAGKKQSSPETGAGSVVIERETIEG